MNLRYIDGIKIEKLKKGVDHALWLSCCSTIAKNGIKELAI